MLDTSAAVAFLRWHTPAGPWLLVAISDDRLNLPARTFTADEVPELEEWIREQNEVRGWNVYFSVNPTRRAMRKKPEATDIAELAWLHVDMDPQPDRPLEDEQKRIIAALARHDGLPAPSAVVFSGGGYQAFWRLRTPLPLDGTHAKAEDAKLYNLQVEYELGADRCHNVDRIMRLPGTVNHPNEKKRKRGQRPVVAVALSLTDNVYDLSEFKKAKPLQGSAPDAGGGTIATRVTVSGERGKVKLESLPAELSARVKVVIARGKDEEQPLDGQDQSRSAWLLYVVGSLVRAGVPDETIYAIITDPDYLVSASVLDKGNSAQVQRYAIRQIKRAKEDKIAPELGELNSQYALVESVGGRLRVAKEIHNKALDRHEVEFLLVDGFRTMFGNRYVEVVVGQDADGEPKKKVVALGKWWLEHPERRTYSTVAFYPCKDLPGVLNLWRGFAYDAAAGDCSLYLEHLRRVVCQGKQEHYDYLIRWMANGVQNPHKPGQVAVVLRGKQGTGKGVAAKHYGRLFGTHFKHVVNPEHITGQFNTILHDAVFVFADECFRNDKAHVSTLKALVTEDTIRVEAKGVDNLESRNCARIWMNTNDDWAVNVSLDDRRFFVLDVPDERRKDTAYFGAIEEQMKSGGYSALLHYLLTLDLTDFDVRRAPRTEELKRQQQRSMAPQESYWYQCLEDGRLTPAHAGWTGEVLADEFSERFLAGYGRAMTVHQAKTALGMFFGKIGCGHVKARLRGRTVEWRDSQGRVHINTDPTVWRFNGLAQCREAWDREYGAQDWTPIDDDPPDLDGGGAF